LISSLIFKDLEKGRFRFTDFYTRRIKRILPAYIVVSLFTLAISTYLLTPNDSALTMFVLTQFPRRNRWVSTTLAALGMAMMADRRGSELQHTLQLR
jgi:peptidoglycan/LPS O-acetylase OafA/YrhL